MKTTGDAALSSTPTTTNATPSKATSDADNTPRKSSDAETPRALTSTDGDAIAFDAEWTAKRDAASPTTQVCVCVCVLCVMCLS